MNLMKQILMKQNKKELDPGAKSTQNRPQDVDMSNMMKDSGAESTPNRLQDVDMSNMMKDPNTDFATNLGKGLAKSMSKIGEKLKNDKIPAPAKLDNPIQQLSNQGVMDARKKALMDILKG